MKLIALKPLDKHAAGAVFDEPDLVTARLAIQMGCAKVCDEEPAREPTRTRRTYARRDLTAEEVIV